MAPISNPESFWNEARFQRVCQRPDCHQAGAFHAHHVVAKGILRDRHHIPQSRLYDTRLAMRLCPISCHFQFENRMIEIPLTALQPMHFEVAFEFMGMAAFDYLRGRYSGDDPRLEEYAKASLVGT